MNIPKSAKPIKIFQRLAILAWLCQGASAQPLPILDGRSYLKSVVQPDSATSSVVREEVRRRAQEAYLQKRLANLAGPNFDDEFEIRGCARGRFTSGVANQTAVLYRYSYTNGVVILDAGKVVAHYSGDPGDYAHYTAIAAAPDIHQNGLSELILFRNVEDSADIYAYLFDGGSYLGAATVFSSNLRGGDDLPAAQIRDTAYLVQAKPGVKPAFSRVTYQRGKSTNWKQIRATSPFPLDRSQAVSLKRIDE